MKPRSAHLGEYGASAGIHLVAQNRPFRSRERNPQSALARSGLPRSSLPRSG